MRNFNSRTCCVQARILLQCRVGLLWGFVTTFTDCGSENIDLSRSIHAALLVALVEPVIMKLLKWLCEV